MISREIARRMRLFEVRTRKLMESGLGGEYRSVFRGRGVEFDEVRPYVEGDDVRSIDWNVTARTDDPHIKKHVEEREQTVVLVADLSASVRYGSGAQRKPGDDLHVHGNSLGLAPEVSAIGDDISRPMLSRPACCACLRS